MTLNGMNVETVKKNGSDGQKLMAPLFDRNHDGVYDKNEAELFNKYRFKTEDGKITLFRYYNDGSRQITEIKYDNFEEDVLSMYNGEPLNQLHRFNFKNDKGEDCFFSSLAKYTKAVIDMVKGTVHVENADGGSIRGNNVELTLKDSDLEEVSIRNGSLNLGNTKNATLLWDSATRVSADGNSIINADENSNIEVIPKN